MIACLGVGDLHHGSSLVYKRHRRKETFFARPCSSSRARLDVEAMIWLNTCEIHVLCPCSEPGPGSWCPFVLVLAQCDGISECGAAMKTYLLIFKTPLLHIQNIYIKTANALCMSDSNNRIVEL